MATAIAIQEEGTSGRGTVPAGLRAQAAIKLRPSKVSWQRQLSASVRRAVGSRSGDFDNTWSRRSRRSNGGCSRTGGRVMRPGTFTPTPTIAVVRDTSGSMGADRRISAGNAHAGLTLGYDRASGDLGAAAGEFNLKETSVGAYVGKKADQGAIMGYVRYGLECGH